MIVAATHWSREQKNDYYIIIDTFASQRIRCDVKIKSNAPPTNGSHTCNWTTRAQRLQTPLQPIKFPFQLRGSYAVIFMRNFCVCRGRCTHTTLHGTRDDRVVRWCDEVTNKLYLVCVCARVQQRERSHKQRNYSQNEKATDQRIVTICKSFSVHLNQRTSLVEFMLNCTICINMLNYASLFEFLKKLNNGGVSTVAFENVIWSKEAKSETVDSIHHPNMRDNYVTLKQTNAENTNTFYQIIMISVCLSVCLCDWPERINRSYVEWFASNALYRRWSRWPHTTYHSNVVQLRMKF